MKTRSLERLRARVDRLAAALNDNHCDPPPPPDDPQFLAWACRRYGLERLLLGASRKQEGSDPAK